MIANVFEIIDKRHDAPVWRADLRNFSMREHGQRKAIWVGGSG